MGDAPGGKPLPCRDELHERLGIYPWLPAGKVELADYFAFLAKKMRRGLDGLGNDFATGNQYDAELAAFLLDVRRETAIRVSPGLNVEIGTDNLGLIESNAVRGAVKTIGGIFKQNGIVTEVSDGGILVPRSAFDAVVSPRETYLEWLAAKSGIPLEQLRPMADAVLQDATQLRLAEAQQASEIREMLEMKERGRASG